MSIYRKRYMILDNLHEMFILSKLIIDGTPYPR